MLFVASPHLLRQGFGHSLKKNNSLIVSVLFYKKQFGKETCSYISMF